MKYFSKSAEETMAFGQKFGERLLENSVVCFFGDLAAGKTTFIKGLVEAVCGCSRDEVISPTFVYLNIYQGKKSVFHFDLYRLNDSDEFLSMGFDEFFTAGGICCVEWSERIANLLPKDVIRVQMSHCGENQREIQIG